MAKKRKEKELKAVKAAKVRKKRKSRRRKRAAILILEVIILALLSGTAFVMAKYDKFQTVDIKTDDIEINDGVEQEGYTTVALFGGDSREGQLEEGTHADTIIIASINNKTKEIRMASVYRDTLLKQESGGYHKANNAYFHGGPQEAINMLNRNLDLDIQDYVTVDFKALSDVIDLLGGLEIEVTDAEAKMLNEYVDETASVAGKESHHLEGGGTYNLDGPQAVTYARLRKLEGGDYKRTERQRLVIQKIFEKVIHTNISTINDIIDTVFPQVSTSFTLKELLGLASGMTKYKLGDTVGFPIDKTEGSYKKAGSVVVPIGLTENVQQLHDFLYPDEAPFTATETVKEISKDISYLTGVERPADYDEQKAKESEETTEDEPDSSIPVITDAE